MSCHVLKESENDAVVSVYSDSFFAPFDDESPQHKTTREEEEMEEENWRRLKRLTQEREKERKKGYLVKLQCRGGGYTKS